mgnify:CR=1 FL=1
MKKLKVHVRHYWAKTVDGEYGGLVTQLSIELLVTFIFVSISIYSVMTDGLGLFFAAFLIPTVGFVIASLTTIYAMISAYRDIKKSR